MRTTLFRSFWPVVRPATFPRTTSHAQIKPSPVGTAAGQVMAVQTAVQVEKPESKGAKPGLKVSQTEAPGVSDKQVLVKMKLRPVNPADVASTELKYPGFKPTTLPAVPGLEGVGIVEKNGPGASKFHPGQRVVSAAWGGAMGNGTWQQYLAVPEQVLIPVPDSVPDEAAAQFVVNPVTCYGFLDTLQIPAGQWFLQSAASSELGKMMVSLCKHRGIKSINIVRRKDAEEELLGLGADAVICTSEVENIPAKVKEITGGDLAYGAIDPVAGSMTGQLAASVRPGGSVLVFGALGGITLDGIGLRDILFRGVIVTGFWLSRYLPSLSDERRRQVLKEVMQLLVDGVIKPKGGDRYPLEQVKEAIEASQKSGRRGKVLLEG